MLGRLCIIGSLIAVADGIRLVLTGHQDVPGFRHLDTIQFLTQLAWAVGALCAVLGLIALKATGTNPIFRFLSYVPVVGYIASIIGLLLGLTGVPTANNPIGIVGQILAMGGMLVLAILVLAAKRWHGWRKFTPLLTILTIPLGAMLVGITGLDGWFIIINAAATALLGYAILSSIPVAQLRTAAA